MQYCCSTKKLKVPLLKVCFSEEELLKNCFSAAKFFRFYICVGQQFKKYLLLNNQDINLRVQNFGFMY